MKMPTLRRDPAAALAKARAALSAAEDRMAAHLQERAAALLQADDVEAVRAIDQQIDHQRRTVALYQERIAALQGEVAKDSLARREQAKAAAVAVIEANLAKTHAAAVELENAFTRVGECFALYTAARRAALQPWPGDLFPTDMPRYSTDHAVTLIAHALGIEKRWADLRVREIGARIRLADQIADESAGILEMLRAAPLPNLPALDEVAA